MPITHQHLESRQVWHTRMTADRSISRTLDTKDELSDGDYRRTMYLQHLSASYRGIISFVIMYFHDAIRSIPHVTVIIESYSMTLGTVHLLS